MFDLEVQAALLEKGALNVKYNSSYREKIVLTSQYAFGEYFIEINITILWKDIKRLQMHRLSPILSMVARKDKPQE